MTGPGCAWKRHGMKCSEVATLTYQSAGTTLLLCDLHWDRLRASLVEVFGDWERVAEVEYA